MENVANVNNKLNKELENERVKTKEWEEKAKGWKNKVEKIRKHSEHQYSEMKEDLKKANDTIKKYEIGLNDNVNNTVKQIKNYF